MQADISSSKIFSSLQKDNITLYPLSNWSYSPLLSVPGNRQSPFVCMDLPILDILYEQNQTIRNILCPASFT